MKIQYQKIDKLPENVQLINPAIAMIEHVGDTTSIDLFFTKTIGEDHVLQFHVEPDASFGALSDIVNTILSGIFSGQIEGLTDHDKNEALRAVNIAAGMLAENDVMMKQQNHPDQANKVFYHLMNGQVMYSDATTINWEENIKNIMQIANTIDRCRALIRALLLEDTIHVDADVEHDIQEEDVPVTEYVIREINQFMTSNDIKIDYSLFDKDGVTDREKLIVQLIDIMTVHNELVLVTSLVNTENQIRGYYETMISHMKQSDVKEPTEELVEDRYTPSKESNDVDDAS